MMNPKKEYGFTYYGSGPSTCNAYKILDNINKKYDLHKVMYDRRERRYHYVHCGNLNTRDIDSLLRSYDE